MFIQNLLLDIISFQVLNILIFIVHQTFSSFRIDGNHKFSLLPVKRLEI